jgi:hypothetical protein
MSRKRLVAVVVCALLAALLWWLWSAPPSPPGDDEPPETEPETPVVVVLTATVNDRFVREPCNLVQGSGLFSVAALVKSTEDMVASVPISMGDLTLAEGEPGRVTAEALLTQVLPMAKLAAICAGEGELGFGSEFVRQRLGMARQSLLCANAIDPAGRTLLRGWALLETGKSNVLVVSVAGESLREALAFRGSDVMIADPAAAASRALEEGRVRAEEIRRPVHTAVLLVHGTLDEAAAIIQAVPGFDVAAAAHGPVLPESAPRRVDGVPLYYCGQGLRFAWRVLVRGKTGTGESHRLTRIGGDLTRQDSPYREGLSSLAHRLKEEVFPRLVRTDEGRPTDPRGTYAHADACKECHRSQYERHRESQHARPTAVLARSAFAASTACLPCHVTAPYRVDGWMGPGDESDFGAISCEACHGPGGDHVDVQDGSYGDVSFDVCYGCHLPDRSPGLDAETVWRHWGHGGRPPWLPDFMLPDQSFPR